MLVEFRRDLNLKEGDLLETVVERGGIVLKPKTVVDRYDEEWAKNLLKEAQEEAKRNPKTREEEEAEEKRLLELGECQAKKLGISPQDAEKIVHEYRKKNQNAMCNFLRQVIDYARSPFVNITQ